MQQKEHLPQHRFPVIVIVGTQASAFAFRPHLAAIAVLQWEYVTVLPYPHPITDPNAEEMVAILMNHPFSERHLAALPEGRRLHYLIILCQILPDHQRSFAYRLSHGSPMHLVLHVPLRPFPGPLVHQTPHLVHRPLVSKLPVH